MATILTKKSDTASAVPLAADLTNAAGGAELAVNATDKRLFSKTSGGTVVELGTNPSTLVLPSGSANGVAYLNGSKVVTSGSALVFDGSKLTVNSNSTTTAGFFQVNDSTTTQANSFGSVVRNANDGNGRYSLGAWTAQNASGLSQYAYIGAQAVTGASNYTPEMVFGLSTGASSYAEQMRLTSTGLGIGTSSPTQKLDVAGQVTISSGNGYLWGNGAVQIYSNSSYLRFRTASTDRLEIDSSGNLGLGVTPSAWYSTGYSALQIRGSSLYGTSGNDTNLASNAFVSTTPAWTYIATGTATRYEQGTGAHRWYNAASGTAGNAITFTQAMTLDASGNLLLGTTTTRSRITALGTTATTPTLGTATGTALFCPNDNAYGTMFGSANTGDGWIQQQRVDGTATAYNLILQPSGGNLLVGTTSVLGSAKATFKAGSTLPAISIGMANSSGTYAAQIFFDGDNTDSGSIDVNNDANTTAYTTSSDYRLKLNVQPIANALTKVGQLNPVTWNWKKNPSLNSSGFIAHELQAVCPDAVTGYKDEVDADGNPKYQGIDTSFLVATLTAAIQEQQAIIESLKARLDAANL